MTSHPSGVRRTSVWLVLGLAGLAGGVLGCRGTRPVEPLPTYEWTDPQEALRLLAERHAKVESFSAECAFTLHRQKGSPVGLNGAIAVRFPGELRLRAWKLTQAVFDLTVRPDGVWLWTTDRASGAAEKLLTGDLGEPRWARVWSQLGGELFLAPEGTEVETDGRQLLVARPLAGGDRLVAEIDRPTLTVRTYRVLDATGKATERLELSDYREVAAIPWPTRVVAHSGRGRIEIDLTQVELNGELPTTAFQPPRRATKRR